MNITDDELKCLGSRCKIDLTQVINDIDQINKLLSKHICIKNKKALTQIIQQSEETAKNITRDKTK